MNKKLVFASGVDPFLAIGLSDAKVSLVMPHHLDKSDNFFIHVFGADLDTSHQDISEIDASNSEKCVNGKSQLCFFDVDEIDIVVLPYVNGAGSDFVKSSRGDNVELHYNVKAQNIDSKRQRSTANHRIETVINWPYGFCYLNIWSSGQVEFEFDVNDLVDIREHLTKEPGSESNFC